MKAMIKSTGKVVEVMSRFMPKKRNVPSRDWMCNLSNGTCINESELEYISDDIEGNRIIDIDNVAREYAENHYSEWEETWYDYDGYNAEPENDKLELIDAFIAGAEWQKAKMMEGAVEGEVYLYSSYKREATAILVDIPKENLSDKVHVIILPKED